MFVIVTDIAEFLPLTDLLLLENLPPILALFAPGLVVLFVRSQFVTGRRPPHSEALLSYLIVSVIYYALTFPFVDFALSIHESFYCKVLAWFTLIFIGPVLLGLILGLNIQKDLFRRLLRRGGLHPIHAIPTAWDWKFGRMREEWVLVTLKDGTRFAGLCGQESFISSDPTERDIYIQENYEVDDQNTWTRRENGVLIASNEIQTIEFWPYTSEGNPND